MSKTPLGELLHNLEKFLNLLISSVPWIGQQAGLVQWALTNMTFWTCTLATSPKRKIFRKRLNSHFCTLSEANIKTGHFQYIRQRMVWPTTPTYLFVLWVPWNSPMFSNITKFLPCIFTWSVLFSDEDIWISKILEKKKNNTLGCCGSGLFPRKNLNF